MDLKNFVSECASLKDIRVQNAAQIKSHNLPVIVYGAAKFAKFVTFNLAAFGVEIFGYAVDDAYYTPNKTFLDKPIYRFSELSAQPDKYVFVLGLEGGSNYGNNPAVKFLQNSNITKYAVFVKNTDFAITENYFTANSGDFFVTYNSLADSLSKQIMIAYIKASISHDSESLCKLATPNEQYFNNLTTRKIVGGGTDTLTAARITATR